MNKVEALITLGIVATAVSTIDIVQWRAAPREVARIIARERIEPTLERAFEFFNRPM